MYIWDCSRSVGAGSATTRNTRGLTRSVIALIAPPLPAPSRPSNTTQTLSPLCFTHSWSLTSSTWSLRSSFSYALFVSSSATAVAPAFSGASSWPFSSAARAARLFSFLSCPIGVLLRFRRGPSAHGGSRRILPNVGRCAGAGRRPCLESSAHQRPGTGHFPRYSYPHRPPGWRRHESEQGTVGEGRHHPDRGVHARVGRVGGPLARRKAAAHGPGPRLWGRHP